MQRKGSKSRPPSSSKSNSNSLDRREFLQRMAIAYGIAGTAGISLLLPRSLRGAPVRESADVLILGAGYSGLAAAAAIRRSDPNLKVIVIEGANRIGGRVHTSRDAWGNQVELGAEYVHRDPNTVPLWDEIRRHGLKTLKVPKVSNSFMSHPSFGGELKTPVGAAFAWNVLSAMNMFSNVNAHSGSDLSAAAWVARQKYSPLGQEIATLSLCGHMPGSPEELSVLGFVADRISEQLETPDDYYILSGNSSLAERMAEGLDIRLGRRILAVHYDARGVTVETSEGEIFQASAAVSTFSVGMLKSKEVRFAPELPASKLRALESIEMGQVAKLILPFTEKFWPPEATFLHNLNSQRDAGRTYFHVSWGDKSRMPGLTAYLVGADARRLRTLSDDELIARVCRDLDAIFPAAAPTYRKLKFLPDGSLATMRRQWIDDPFAKGGFSFLGLNGSGDVRKARAALAAPGETPSLFWAGEATSTDTQPSSMHGAYQTGLRAADQVLAFLREGKILTLAESTKLFNAWREERRPKFGGIYDKSGGGN